MFLQTRTLGLFLLAITLVTGLTAPDAMAANEAPADSWERLYSEAIAATSSRDWTWPNSFKLRHLRSPRPSVARIRGGS